MILVFVLLWFSGLWGMEQKTPGLEKRSPVPSLLDIVQDRICCYVIDKKIELAAVQLLPAEFHQPIEFKVIRTACCQIVDRKISVGEARKNLPADILKRIGFPRDCLPKVLADKDIEYYRLGTITPDHRYLLVDTKQGGLARLDLVAVTNKVSVADDFKQYYYSFHALSPSGKLLAVVSFQELLIKDIDRNEVIAKGDPAVLLGDENNYDIQVTFIGENALLIKRGSESFFRIINNNLNKCTTIDHKYVGVLHGSKAYITYDKGTFLINTLPGTVDKSVTVQGLKELGGLSNLKPAVYEPELLIAYETAATSGYISIISLAGEEKVVTPLQLKCKPSTYPIIGPIAFAYKGQWLLVVDKNEKSPTLTIRDWQHNQQLYTYERGDIYPISYTNYPTLYPCLFSCHSTLYGFDPVKATAAKILFQATSPSTTSTSNNNNNSNVSNDNGRASTKSSKREIDK